MAHEFDRYFRTGIPWMQKAEWLEALLMRVRLLTYLTFNENLPLYWAPSCATAVRYLQRTYITLASWLCQEPSPWPPWYPWRHEIPEMRHVHQIPPPSEDIVPRKVTPELDSPFQHPDLTSSPVNTPPL